ncbi:MAG: hypothetical protein ACOY3O_10315 [Thermodesulfobacteriota bacterium]
MKIRIPLFLLVALLPHHPAAATSYPVLYVAPGGSGLPCGSNPAQPCASIATAVDQAVTYSTGTIRVAQGNYAESVAIINNLPAVGVEQLVIEGGWNTAFSGRVNNPSLTAITHKAGLSTIFDLQAGTFENISLRLENLTLRGTSPGNSPAIQANNAAGSVELALSSCVLRDCSGPAVLLSTSSNGNTVLQVDRTLIEENGNDLGGGVMLYGYDHATIQADFTGNRFLNNTAGNYNGGGIYFMASDNANLTASLINNIFAGNSAEMGGALGLQASLTGTVDITLTNNTMVENHSQSGGGGILVSSQDEGDALVTIKNSIVWGNTRSTERGDLHLLQNDPTSTASATANYSLLGSVYAGLGSYTAVATYDRDPKLGAGYHLSSGSPARDSGQCGYDFFTYWRVAPYDDIDGDARPGYGVLWGCDIGADEFTFPWILFSPLFMDRGE